jgi:hypothetical protein
MKAVAIIGLILIAVFVMVMLMTFVFHLIVFRLILAIPNAAKVDLGKNEIGGAMLLQTWVV